MDRKTLEKAVETVKPFAFLKQRFQNWEGEFQIYIDGESTNHHEFDDVPDKVFSERWRVSAMQAIDPDQQTEHVEWLIEMGESAKSPEEEALLDNWLAWASAALADMNAGDADTLAKARACCGVDRNGDAPHDYASKLDFAQALLDLDASQRMEDSSPILDSDTFRDSDNRFYHGFAFSSAADGNVAFERIWARFVDIMDRRQILGLIPEEMMGDSSFLKNLAREKYVIGEQNAQPMPM